jgi:DNA methylase
MQETSTEEIITNLITLAERERAMYVTLPQIAREQGEWLIMLKEKVGRGKWEETKKDVAKRMGRGFSPRTLEGPMSAARHWDEEKDGGARTMTQLRERQREWTKSADNDRWRDDAEVMMETAPPADERYQVQKISNRDFNWPEKADLICTDPPWDEMAEFEWLAGFAVKHLKPGGLLLAQVGNRQLADSLRWLTYTKDFKPTGLTYRHDLVMTFPPVQSSCLKHIGFGMGHRNALLFSNGPWRCPAIIHDHYAMHPRRKESPKKNYDWGQPVEPLRRWLSRLTAPGQTVLDPYCGSGTVAVVCKQIGALHFLGTDSECRKGSEGIVKAAMGRIHEAAEGSYLGEDEDTEPCPECGRAIRK